MKTLKVMAIIGIIWFGGTILVQVNNPDLSKQAFLKYAYGLVFSIVVLVQSKKILKKHKKDISK